MKIVDFESFIRIPAGTIFAPYKPCALQEGLAIKTDTGSQVGEKYCFNGVLSLSPWIDVNSKLCQIGDEEEASFEIYDGNNSDYIEYEMFLIFDEVDVQNLINVLQVAKKAVFR